jgi:predicted house-cleaning noncanonical NTP pyrophosphatase (MazG superfamily)
VTLVEPYFIKLVRDRAEHHVSDAAVTFGDVPREKLHDLLKAKLVEEVGEYLVSPSIHELADIYEVLRALALELDASMKDIERVSLDKYAERGGFEHGRGMFCTTTEEAERLNSHGLKS